MLALNLVLLMSVWLANMFLILDHHYYGLLTLTTLEKKMKKGLAMQEVAAFNHALTMTDYDAGALPATSLKISEIKKSTRNIKKSICAKSNKVISRC